MTPLRFPRRPDNPQGQRPLPARARARLPRPDEPVHRLLTRKWAWTSALALTVALLAGLSTTAAGRQRDTGDLLMGLYFAALSLLLWARAIWIQRKRAIMPSVRRHVAALVVGLGTGGLLVAADIVSGGRL